MTLHVLLLCIYFSISHGTLKVEHDGKVIDMLDVVKTLPYDNPDGGVWKQGWEVTYDANIWKEDKLRVYVVPHSHNDPGWLMTFEEYFNAKTKGILTSVTSALNQNAKRHFIWAEISFFDLWWKQQSQESKEKTKRLIKNGQLEFVTGGWVMNDEATPHYYAIINQLTEGHEWLQKEFQYKPVTAWSIDPFGHSPIQAYLYSLVGFDGMLVQRIHYAIKKYLARDKNLEFLWRQNWLDRGDTSTDIFTHMMPFFSYDIPHTCGPTPAVCSLFDFTKIGSTTPWGGQVTSISSSNLEQRCSSYLDEVRKKSVLYRTKNVLIPLGDDFMYSTQDLMDKQFTNHEQIHAWLNDRSNDLRVEIQFSNLSSYFNAIWERSSKNAIKFPVVSGDFFTYADKDDEYWSGYFTTRPFWKRLERDTEAVTRAAEILYLIATKKYPQHDSDNAIFEAIHNSRRETALFQHHDGTTGTAKDHVVKDYGRRLHNARLGAKKIMTRLLPKVLGRSDHEAGTSWQLDEIEGNSNEIPVPKVIHLGEKGYTVSLFNSLANARKRIVSLLIDTPKVQVTDFHGNEVKIQVNPVFKPDGRISSTEFKLFFKAEIPPLGVGTYFIEESSVQAEVASVAVFNDEKNTGDFLGKKITVSKDPGERITLGNGILELGLSSASGLLETVKKRGREHKLSEQFLEYRTARSGAYLFMAGLQPAKSLNIKKEHTTIRVLTGSLINQVIVNVVGSSLQSRILTLHHKDTELGDVVEVSNVVHVLEENQELVVRYTTDVASGKDYYTDLNGFSMQHRTFRADRPLQHNFYPSTSMAFIQGEGVRFTTVTRQALGVASVSSGTLEFMLDRRLSQDDNRGLGQGITDNLPTEAHFYLLLEESPKKDFSGMPSLQAQRLSLELNHPIQMSFAEESKSHFTSQNDLSYSPVIGPLPPDLHIISWKMRDPQHSEDVIFQITRLPTESLGETNPKIVDVNLENYFRCQKVRQLDEHSLTLLYFKKHWLGTGRPIPLKVYDIKTFLLRYEYDAECSYDPVALPTLPKEPPNGRETDAENNEQLLAIIEDLQQQLNRTRNDLAKERRVPYIYYYALMTAMIFLFAFATYQRSKRSLVFLVVVLVTTTFLPFLFFRSVPSA